MRHKKYKYPDDVASSEEPIFRNGENVDNKWSGNRVYRRSVDRDEARRLLGKYFQPSKMKLICRF